ncbi:MAG: hypothetical protein AB7N91_26415 [Candidatus Tectimicrobiota bacterium]
MSVTHYHLDRNFQATDVVRWYTRAALGDMAVIALTERPAIRLRCFPNNQVYWCTDGCKGLTVSLDDATQRLGMLQTRWAQPLPA